jgi:hypothetical protein
MTARASLLASSLAFGAALLASGCTDPCVALAERICNCEPTLRDRRSCTIERVTNQQGRVQISDDDRAACSAALDTCTCAALDENNLEACGFAPASGADG